MRSTLAVFGLCCVVTTNYAAEPEDQYEYVLAVIEADGLGDQHESLSKLFHLLTTDEIADLKSHPHDSIALAAAWHEVLETIPERTKPETIPRHGSNYEPVALERFVGFAEGRLRLRIPKVWQDSLRNTRVYGPNHIFVPEFTYWPQHRTDAGLFAPLSVHARKEDNVIAIRTEGEDYELPEEALPQQPEIDTSLVAALNDDYCVCAFHGDVGFPYKLKCIKRAGNEVLWTAKVFNAFSGGGTTGTGFQSRSLMKIKDERVLVFGTCLVGSYLEVFSLKTGEALCRFSTTIHE